MALLLTGDEADQRLLHDPGLRDAVGKDTEEAHGSIAVVAGARRAVPKCRSDGPAVLRLPTVVGRSRAAVLSSRDRVVREAQEGAGRHHRGHHLCAYEPAVNGAFKPGLPFFAVYLSIHKYRDTKKSRGKRRCARAARADFFRYLINVKQHWAPLGNVKQTLRIQKTLRKR